MPVAEQQQKPQAAAKATLNNGDAEAVAKLTKREGWKEFTVDDILMAWDQFPDGTATQILAPEYRLADFKRFIRLAAAKGLDPLLNDLHYEFRNDKNSPTGMKGTAICHQSADLKIAHRSGLLDGIEQKDATDERGFYVQTFVYKKNCSKPFTFKAYLREFKPSNAYEGTPWSKMEFNMTAKCSRAGCLRIAFPEELGGMVTEDEMDYEDRGRQQQPTAPPQGITVGEIQKPADKPAPEPPKAEPPKQQAPAPEPPKAEAPKAETGQLKQQAQGDKGADDKGDALKSARAQYSSRLAMLVGPQSKFAQRGPNQEPGLNKAHIDEFFCGYYGLPTKGQLVPDPSLYLPVFDDLIARLGQDVGELQTLIANPRKYGEYRKLAAEPKPGPSAPVDIAAELSKRFGWNPTLCGVAANFMAKVDLVTVDDFKNEVLDPSGMSQMSEQQIETCLLVAYYDAAALGKLIQSFQKTKMPLMWYQVEIEKVSGPLAGGQCDPAKVMAGVEKAAIAATGRKLP